MVKAIHLFTSDQLSPVPAWESTLRSTKHIVMRNVKLSWRSRGRFMWNSRENCRLLFCLVCFSLSLSLILCILLWALIKKINNKKKLTAWDIRVTFRVSFSGLRHASSYVKHELWWSYLVTTWNKSVTSTTLIYGPQCHTYPVTTWNNISPCIKKDCNTSFYLPCNNLISALFR